SPVLAPNWSGSRTASRWSTSCTVPEARPRSVRGSTGVHAGEDGVGKSADTAVDRFCGTHDHVRRSVSSTVPLRIGLPTTCCDAIVNDMLLRAARPYDAAALSELALRS